MAWDNAVITNAGIDLLNGAFPDEPLILSFAAGGVGTVDPTALREQSELRDQRQTFRIVGKKNVGNGTRVNIQILNTGLPSGYVMQQIGIWARTATGVAVLFAILQDETGISIPSPDEMPDFSLNFYAILAVSNECNFQLAVEPSTLVTQVELTDRIDEAMATKLDIPHGPTPGPVTNLSYSPSSGGGLYIDWDAPTSSNLAKTVLIRSSSVAIGRPYPQTPTDGTVVIEISNKSTGIGVFDTGLTPGITYHYSIFTLNDSGNWNKDEVVSFSYQAGGNQLEPLWGGSPLSYGSTFTPIRAITGGKLFYARIYVGGVANRTILFGPYSYEDSTGTAYIQLGGLNETGTPAHHTYAVTLSSSDEGRTWTYVRGRNATHLSSGTSGSYHGFADIELREFGGML